MHWIKQLTIAIAICSECDEFYNQKHLGKTVCHVTQADHKPSETFSTAEFVTFLLSPHN